MIRPSAGIFAIAFTIGGCGHMETHHVLLRAPEAPSSNPVELYMADQPPPARPFYEIGLVQAIGFGSDAHPEEVARALSEKAAHLGCDAILKTFIDQGYSRAHAAGVCVKWLGPGPSGPPPILPPRPSDNPPPPAARPNPAPKIEQLPSASPGQGNPN
jgi:hypothetical protein